MNISYNQCIYEKLIPSKKISYWLFYPTISIFLFFLSGFVLISFKEESFLFIRLFFLFATGVIPILIILFASKFRSRAEELAPILWKDESDFKDWAVKKNDFIFTLSSKESKIVTFGIVLLAYATILYSGLPLQNLWLNLLGLIGFLPFIFICGHAAFVCAQLFFLLPEIATKQIRVPFFKLPHPVLNGLYGDYSSLVFLQTIGYTLLFLAAWQSPYGLTFSILIWLTILATYPFVTFIWSIYIVHIIMVKIKNSHLEIINNQIQVILQRITTDTKTDLYDQLSKAMEIQHKVQSMSEWPISFSGAITFVLTTSTAIIQVFLSIVQILKL